MAWVFTVLGFSSLILSWVFWVLGFGFYGFFWIAISGCSFALIMYNDIDVSNTQSNLQIE